MNGLTFPAIGTTVHLLVTDRRALAPANRLLRDFLADLDRAASRFRPDSALSTVNRLGSASNVDPLLFGAVQVALAAAEQTDGLVDPTLGSSLIAIGYDRSFAGVARSSPSRVTAVPGSASWREIVVDEQTRSITLPRGVRLDLGATAKAWAADIAAGQIAGRLGCGTLVNLGGDLAIAGPSPVDGWRVRVADDHAARGGGQVVAVRSGGVATSSTTVRRWKRAEQVLHHVLDPKTGLPARRVWQYVSVAAADCVTANTAATAAIVLGDRAPSWLSARDLAARLVAAGGSVVRVAGWPAGLSTMEAAA
jgi:thiamine biosynthesis lipoprotein